MLSSRFSSTFAFSTFFALAAACGSGDEASSPGGNGTGGTLSALGGAAGNGGRGGSSFGGADSTSAGGSASGAGSAAAAGMGASSAAGTAGTGTSVGGSSSAAPEICGNGLDDNGNGIPDDGCACAPGTTQSCFPGAPMAAGIGACARGSQACKESGSGEFQGGRWGECVGAGASVAEVCANGIDDDCDGAVDDGCSCAEGSTMPCSTACGQGVMTCTGGVLGACSAKSPAAESCDGIDNDCDGTVDDELDVGCTGACGDVGVKKCVNGAYAACTSKLPAEEICDGVDNDCDGMVDDGLDAACTGVCGDQGVKKCVAGAYGACVAKLPAVEICDGVDNDCDGSIDEDGVCPPLCGASDEGSFPNKTPPTEGLCERGTASAVATNEATYTWSCAVGGGPSVGCSAKREAAIVPREDGACSASACSAGTYANYMAGPCDGANTWQCIGKGGGTTASCAQPTGVPCHGCNANAFGPSSAGCSPAPVVSGGASCQVDGQTGVETYTIFELGATATCPDSYEVFTRPYTCSCF